MFGAPPAPEGWKVENLGQSPPAEKPENRESKAPAIQLRSLPTEPLKGGDIKVGIQWEIQEQNLDTESVRLDARWVGQSSWYTIASALAPRTLLARGEDAWRLKPNQRMEIRIRAKDKSGNSNEAIVTLGATLEK
jgi:hypothetical protein